LTITALAHYYLLCEDQMGLKHLTFIICHHQNTGCRGWITCT